MIVTISGLAGSGKTTTAELVGKKLDVPVFSAGKIFRREAEKRNMQLMELSNYANKHPEVDCSIERRMMSCAQVAGSAVLEGRLTAWATDKCGAQALKAHLDALLPLRAERVACRDKKTYSEALREVKRRDETERREKREKSAGRGEKPERGRKGRRRKSAGEERREEKESGEGEARARRERKDGESEKQQKRSGKRRKKSGRKRKREREKGKRRQEGTRESMTQRDKGVFAISIEETECGDLCGWERIQKMCKLMHALKCAFRLKVHS